MKFSTLFLNWVLKFFVCYWHFKKFLKLLRCNCLTWYEVPKNYFHRISVKFLNNLIQKCSKCSNYILSIFLPVLQTHYILQSLTLFVSILAQFFIRSFDSVILGTFYVSTFYVRHSTHNLLARFYFNDFSYIFLKCFVGIIFGTLCFDDFFVTFMFWYFLSVILYFDVFCNFYVSIWDATNESGRWSRPISYSELKNKQILHFNWKTFSGVFIAVYFYF